MTRPRVAALSGLPEERPARIDASGVVPLRLHLPEQVVRKGLLQRCWTHDYRARSICMVTLTSVNRAPIFGQLAGDETEPYVKLSDAGRHD